MRHSAAFRAFPVFAHTHTQTETYTFVAFRNNERERQNAAHARARGVTSERTASTEPRAGGYRAHAVALLMHADVAAVAEHDEIRHGEVRIAAHGARRLDVGLVRVQAAVRRVSSQNARRISLRDRQQNNVNCAKRY